MTASGRHVSPDGRGDYIPYTNKPLSWHTDGYYNGHDNQIHAWTLFCLHPASAGGENAVLDHEIAYLLLRDICPRHIEALAHPETLVIPAHLQDGKMIRPDSVGPVFSLRQGRLHMRYSARGRHVRWRETPDTEAARQALDQLLSQTTVCTFKFRMQSGEGLVTNNVLHNRSGFTEDRHATQRRLLYRVRYLDWIAVA